MKTNINEYCKNKAGQSADFSESPAMETKSQQIHTDLAGIIDHKVALLSVAGTAVHLNAEPCLERIVHELEATGITKADIRTAVESGRFVGLYPELGAKVFKHACGNATDDEFEYAADEKEISASCA